MNNIAVYTDELAEEPETACQLARGLGLQNVVLRRVWGGNIGNCLDKNCKKILAATKKNALKIVALATEDGRVPAHELGNPASINAFRRNLVLANYFHAKQIRLYAGMRTNKESHVNIEPKIRNWMNLVAQECRASSIVPVLEIDPEAYYFEPHPILALLRGTQGWKLQYDPALLMLRRNHNHIESYWSVLRDYVANIDLHDCQANAGFVPVGSGKCMWPALIEDCVQSGFTGWMFVEPGPSRRGGVPVGRRELCTIVLESYGKLVKDAASVIKERNKKPRK